jgi:hypothetical protein
MESENHVTSSSFKIAQQRKVRESTEILSTLAVDFLKKPTFRRVLHTSIRNVLSAWSGSSPMRQRFSDRVMNVALKTLPLETQVQPANGRGDFGRLLTILAENANANLAENPARLADNLTEPLEGFFKNTDFGEIKELLDRSEDSIVELVRRLMDYVWNIYPAKLGALMPMVHPLGNPVIRSLKEIIVPLNGVSPDLLADLIINIVFSIDGHELGQLTNGLMEMGRQLHTGSLLQGESGVPQFQMELTNKLRDIVSKIDPELMTKMKIIGAEHTEERAHARSAIMEENPALVLDIIAHLAEMKNPGIRALSRRVRVFEDLPQGGLAASITNGLAELDTQTLAEICNAALQMFNQVHAEKPEFFARLLENFFMNVDSETLKTATQWIVRDVVEGLRPLANDVLPVLVDGLKELNRA